MHLQIKYLGLTRRDYSHNDFRLEVEPLKLQSFCVKSKNTNVPYLVPRTEALVDHICVEMSGTTKVHDKGSAHVCPLLFRHAPIALSMRQIPFGDLSLAFNC